MTWFSYTLWILAISTVALPILILAAGLAFRNVGQEKKQERSRFTKWLGAQSSYLPLALALFGLFLVAMRVMHEDAWRWFGKQGAFFCWSLAIGLGALCLLCPKSGLQWVGLGLIILFAVQFLETPVSRGLQKLEELRGEETTSQPTTKMATQSRLVTATAPTNNIRTKSKTVIAPTQGWSETVTTPLLAWFQIRTEENVRVKTKSGKLRMAGPDYVNDWWGDNLSIADSTYQFQSVGGNPVSVTILWQPK